MKKIIYATVVLLVSCAKPYGTEADIKAMRDMLNGSKDAWNAGSIKGYMSFYLNDSHTQFISRKGRTMGWQKTLEMYLKSYPDKASMGHLSFEEDTIRVLSARDQLGQVTGRWKLIRATDTPQGFFSLITRNTAEGPKIIIDHTW